MTEKKGLKEEEVTALLNFENFKKNLLRIKEVAEGLKTDKSLGKELIQRLFLLYLSLGITTIVVCLIAQPEIVVEATNTLLQVVNPELEFYELFGSAKHSHINNFLRVLLIGSSVRILNAQQQPVPETNLMPPLEMYRRVALAKFKQALQLLNKNNQPPDAKT